VTIQIDSREKARAIQKIIGTFDKQGVKWFISKLPVGDYMSFDNPRLIIDRKQNLSELCGNVCQQHKRFRAELERANEYGIKLVVLCEHGKSITCLSDVMQWVNPRLKKSPMAVSGERLYKILSAMSQKYSVDFLFCTKAETGQRIIELLEVGNE
jgi:ERCC4-type nuclease